MHIKEILTIVFVLFIVTLATAQHKGKSCMICTGNKTHNEAENPYKDFSFKNERLFLGGVLGLVGTSLLINNPTPLSLEKINLLDANTINSFDRYATRQSSENAQKLSDVFLSGVLVLPAIFLSNHHTRKDLLPLIVLTSEVAIINVGLTSIAKKLAGRTRPLVYNDHFSLEEKQKVNARLSFFSGHTSHVTSISFMMAKVMADYHPHTSNGFKIGIWSFAATLPAVTGYLRIKAGKHFPTDVIGGYIFGGLVGILVPHLHRKNQVKKNKKYSLTPYIGGQHLGLVCQF